MKLWIKSPNISKNKQIIFFKIYVCIFKEKFNLAQIYYSNLINLK